jgi:hypothetical protein
MKQFVVSVFAGKGMRDFVERHPVTRRDYFYYSNKQSGEEVPPTVYCDDEVSANNVAEMYAAKYPHCSVLVAKTNKIVQASPVTKFTTTSLTEQGLLPT